MAVEIEGDDSPLLQSSLPYSSCLTSDQTVHKGGERSGTIWTALAHIITAVIGSGVLSLAWSMSQLGWIAGPLIMLAFASVTIISALLLCNCYSSSNPDNGSRRNASYLDAVQTILGEKIGCACGLILRFEYIKTGIVYTVTSSISMRAIQRSNCYHFEGHSAPCEYENTYYMLIFGVIQVMLSQIPDFQNTEWLSIFAAIMSFAYSIIGSALGLAKVIEHGEIKGDIHGVPYSTASEKVWSVAQALGNIAFAFPFSLLFLEIMDTLKSNPPQKATMKKTSIVALYIITFFYLCCGGFGYAAFGNSTPGNMLTGFGFYEPYWLVDFANACVVLHLVGGYQVFLTLEILKTRFEQMVVIASQLPGIDLVSHKPFSHLITEIASPSVLTSTCSNMAHPRPQLITQTLATNTRIIKLEPLKKNKFGMSKAIKEPATLSIKHEHSKAIYMRSLKMDTARTYRIEKK